MSEKKMRRLGRGDLVLVTGANGYIGSHVVDVLLEQGLRVRGSVRGKKLWLENLFERRHGAGRFETFDLPSFDDESVLAEALKDVKGIVHVASAVAFSPDPTEVIPIVINNTLAILKAAATQPSVRSVVLTSSSTAAGVTEPNTEVVIDENTWNDAAVQAAHSGQVPAEMMPLVVYAASKTEGERAAWNWYRENKPEYAFNAVLPNANFGAILSPEIHGSTMGWTRSLLDGDDAAIKTFTPQWYVDVKDCARLHVAALLDPSISNERLFGYAGKFNCHDIVDVLRRLRPQNTRIPNPPENEGRDVSDVKPAKRAEQIIIEFFNVRGWVSLEDSLAAGIAGHAVQT